MFDLSLVGDPHPLDEAALDGIAHLSKEYVDLMKKWGPGRAKAHLDFPDPRSKTFANLQLRFRLHAPHQKAMGRWTTLDADALETGVVIGRFRDGAVLVGVQARLVTLLPNGKEEWQWTLKHTIHWCAGVESPKNKPPPTYCTALDNQPGVHAALADGDEELADACMGKLFERESAWGLLELASALASSSIPTTLRASYFDQCMRMVKRVDAECIAAFPLRAMRDELANTGTLSLDHARTLDHLAHAPSPFNGEMTDIEQQLATEVIRNPRERAPCIVLADHLETLGQTLRASLVREQAEAMSYDEVAERGLEFADVDGDKTLAQWIAAWGAHAPAALTAVTDPIPSQVRSAIISWIERATPDNIARLAKEPASLAFVVLGLRSSKPAHITACARIITELGWKDAAHYLLDAMRACSNHALEDLAVAFHDVGRLAATDLRDVLTWLESNALARRRAACIVLQRSGKDDRVLEAMLTHFCDGHPYTERTIARRKTDPRVIPTLLAAFERAEAASLKDGRTLVYTQDYGILSRYLAKLGNTRGKEAWERFKKMGRIERAASDREARREGM